MKGHRDRQAIVETLNIYIHHFIIQNDDSTSEIEISSDLVGRDGEKVDQSNFELLKVLGQGSFSKVNFILVSVQYWRSITYLQLFLLQIIL